MVNWIAAEGTAGQHWLRMEETAGPSASLGMTEGGVVFPW
jgi:hypothetical protein